ncbi:MAG: tetratricopeptide repeat protein [Acidobacteriia bacterium]|nr:tetratricopeptide repeat protein [Terriglobia bacterium]
MNLRSLTVCFVLVFSSLSLLADDDHHHGMDPNEKLGSVSFPISCAAEVQKTFERGVALMHSFEYEPAENAFKEVAARDPQCAMAYWGQAMSLYHSLWARLRKEDLSKGRAILEKASQAHPKTTQRERDYIKAVSVLYRLPNDLEYHARVDAYAEAMQGVHERNPKDREAAVFYALALLGSGPERDETHANGRKAVAILNKLYDEQPDHPGIAHYIIHACDNPAMASLGLAAARKYAAIAPSSPHAVHMPSHIFARLGLWQESIASNTAALKAADKMAGMHLHTMHHRMHSMDFMQYAYLQIGDDASAKSMYDAMTKYNRADVEEDYQDYYDEMLSGFAALYAVERRQWKDAVALQPVAGAKPNIQAVTYWARAVGAGHLHDPGAAQDALKHYEEGLEALRKGTKAYLANGLKDEHEEVQAWTLYTQGKADDALRILRAIADRQDKVGKFEVEIPAREMLADMLLDMNKPKEALAEYEISLKTDPNRFNGLAGAAQAAEKLSLKEKASGYYAQLLKNCQGIDSDRPELARAKTLVAAK